MPIEITFVDENQRPVYRQLYMELTNRLSLLGRYTSRILSALISNEPLDWDRVQVLALYNAWLQTMVENGPTLNEIKRYQVTDSEEDESLRVNMNAAIFAELSRLHFILHYKQLKDEQSDLLNLEKIPTREEQKRLLSMWSLNLTEAQLWTDIPLPEDVDWDTPVLKYTQKEVMAATSMLCEIMNDLGSISKPSVKCPYEECTREFMEYFRALFTRNSVFFCQSSCLVSTLNVPDMRDTIVIVENEEYRPNVDYFVWCSFYFGAIMRRIYYWENLKNNVIRPKITPPTNEIERCRCFIETVAVQLGEDAYEDCYTLTCDESYDIPGDCEWFAYKYPSKQPAMGNILYHLRPVLRDRYWKEAHMALETVLVASRQPQPRYFMRTSQLFVINVLDSYLRTTNVMWRNAAVVSQDGIELSAWKLSRASSPILLQVFSRWWVYHDLFYQPCDDIYEAIVVWFRILRTHCNDKLFGTSLKEIANKILL